MILVAPVLFFALLEGGLALFGVEPVLREEDPFVGFAGNVPLFEERRAPNGKKVLATAGNKLRFFNQQMFLEEKASDTYRIFCLGGSTTYGRPYNDTTSFSGWLRELLPAVDGRRDWEVVNVGGISYASYRVTRLMEELVQYQPDLFIIYTGQNEFLEERTYGKLRHTPEIVRSTVGLLARTRTWAALQSGLGSVGVVTKDTQPRQVELAAEVDAILDHSAGPKDYHRNDAMRDGVMEHFRISLQRMADIAEKAGAKVIFVTPASNLKDCSPFKSEHTAGLNGAQVQESERLLAEARMHLQGQKWDLALETLDRAIALDPRFAEIHFGRGQALFALRRFDEAKGAFQRARDEDVCSLRALTQMPGMVAEVARENGLALIDFVDLVEQATVAKAGHSIAGEEYFLDHVHPTIEGHKKLAVALVETMIRDGIVQPGGNWNPATIARIEARIKSRIDPRLQAQALVNLAKVLHWAGKFEDAKRLAEQGLAAARGDGPLTAQASDILIKMAKLENNSEQIDQYTEAALAVDPGSPVMHYHLGMRLLQGDRRPEGAAHILFASAFWEANETASLLGTILYKNGRLDLAYPLLEKALQIDPDDRISRLAFDDLQQRIGSKAQSLPPVEIAVTRYPSGMAKEIFIKGRHTADREPPDGLWTEWHENGSLKGYAEYASGLRHGVELQWNQSGKLQARKMYDHGVRTGS